MTISSFYYTAIMNSYTSFYLYLYLGRAYVAVSERLMTLRVPLSKSRFMTIICAYAPTLTSYEHSKCGACSTKHYIPFSDQLLAATSCFLWVTLTPESELTTVSGVIIGRHGVGTVNSNGLRLLNCSTAKQTTPRS